MWLLVLWQLRGRFIPTVERMGGGVEEVGLKLQEYCVKLAGSDSTDGLRMVAAVIEASKPTIPAHQRLLREVVRLTETVVLSAYAVPTMGACSAGVEGCAPWWRHCSDAA